MQALSLILKNMCCEVHTVYILPLCVGNSVQLAFVCIHCCCIRLHLVLKVIKLKE